MAEWWTNLKLFLDYLIVPIVTAIVMLFRSQAKRHIDRLDMLEAKMIDAEKQILVMQTQMTDIKKDIDEIKLGIQKLVDKLCKP